MDDSGDGPVCGHCGRPIPPGVPQSLHHLVPKLKGGEGGPTVLLHHICHREIHAALTEAELARDFATPEALRAHPRLALHRLGAQAPAGVPLKGAGAETAQVAGLLTRRGAGLRRRGWWRGRCGSRAGPW